MKEVKIVVEEIYKIQREITLYMNNQEYKDWTNEEHSPVDGIFRKSNSISDFIDTVKEMKDRNEDCGFSHYRLSNYEDDKKLKENVSLDIFYMNSGQE